MRAQFKAIFQLLMMQFFPAKLPIPTFVLCVRYFNLELQGKKGDKDKKHLGKLVQKSPGITGFYIVSTYTKST